MKREEPPFQTHPAYGNAVFHRTTGGIGKLYGSSLPDHHTSVRLTIGRSQFKHDLGRDWHYAPLDEQLIEVEFSSAQFAELITTMNVGSGVCCTIRHLREGDQLTRVPPLPQDEQLEAERVVDAFKAKTDEIVRELEKGIARTKELLAKKGALTVKEKEEISAILARAHMEAKHNAPFMVEQFQEATDKTVTAAKAEVDASLTAVVARLGFERLQEQGGLLPAAPAGALEAPLKKKG